MSVNKFEPNYVSFFSQLRALLIRNYLIKSRKKLTLFLEIFFPFVFILWVSFESHQRFIPVRSEPTIVAPLYPSRALAKDIFLCNSTWYIINNGTLRLSLLQEYEFALREVGQAICAPWLELFNKSVSTSIVNTEKDFDELLHKESNKVQVAIAFQAFNFSREHFVKYSLRLPLTEVASIDSKVVCQNLSSAECSAFQYYLSGFSLMQAIIDSSILKLSFHGSVSANIISNFSIGIFPHEKQVDSSRVSIFPMMVLMSFFFSIPATAVMLVRENEKRIKIALYMMGLSRYAYWIGWTLVQCSLLVPVCIIWTVILPCFGLLSVNPILLYILIQLAAITFVLLGAMISPFLRDTKTASIVAAILSIAILGIPSYMISIMLPSKLLFAVLFFVSSVPFSFTLNSLFASDTDVSFTNMYGYSEFPIGESILFLIFDCIIYMFFVMFFDYMMCNNVFSWLKEKFRRDKRSESSSRYCFSSTNIESVEEEFRDKKAIQVQNITKTFDSTAALDNVSLDIYESQITAILGSNGAGKTTLIGILTGEFPPSCGSISIYGLDVQRPSDLCKLRTRFGVCLQEDILFEELTPREHLRFFARMKGLTGTELTEEVNRILRLMDLDMEAIQRSPSDKLSGGEKRKLCIGIALIGNSQIIFLDEPTSGVDAYSRRKIWSVLQTLKRDRVIILTTHFMDEADVLSDRKVFIFSGRVHCMGSSLFLKSKFGVGYHLRLDIESRARENDICTVLTRSVPSAQLERITNSEMIFTLPKNETDNFVALFNSLDKLIKENALGVKGYGITMTTLEDVFLNLCKQMDRSNQARESSDQINDCKVSSIEWKAMQPPSSPNFKQKSFAFTKLRFLLVIRNKAFASGLILDILLIFLISEMLMTYMEPSHPAALDLNTTIYDGMKTLLFMGNNTEASALNSLSSYCVPKHVSNFTQGTMQDAIYALRFDSTSSLTIDQLLFSYNYTHALPILQNLITNLYASKMNSSLHIETASHPLPDDSLTTFRLIAIGAFVLFLTPAFCHIPAVIAAEVVDDREAKIKAYLHASGLRVSEYWCGLLTAHGTIFCGVCYLVAFFSMAILPVPFLYDNWQSLMWLFLLLTLYTPTALLICYVLSFLFSSKESAHSILPILTYLPTFAVLILFFICNQTHVGLCFLLLLLWPFIIPMVVFFTLFVIYVSNLNGANLSYMAWNEHLVSSMTALILNIIFYSILLILIDQNKLSWNKVKSSPTHETRAHSRETLQQDLDVKEEEKRVDDLFKNMKQLNKKPLLLMKNVSKAFENTIAVRSLNLVVDRGQIFGLLGTNGAGKTTTMRILIGDEEKSSGHILIDGQQINYSTERSDILSYCPQDNPLWGSITLLEHLQLFCAIRGVPPEKIDTFTESLLKMFAIEEHASKQVETLSGGTKRKLCLLISIIGNTKLTLLDEPSTGMDPYSKRFMWNIIMCNFEPNGEKSAILTSHSMEEVDALCTRMAIMVKGSLECLGTIQYLNDKFGSGYILEVKLKHNCRLKCESIQKLAVQLFSRVTVIEELSNYIKMEVQQADIPSFGLTFQTLQNWLHTYPEIEEYSFCQSSIERVFIRFARNDSVTYV